MASLLQRVDILIAANLHHLASTALRDGNLAIIDGYLRKVQNTLTAVEDAVATIGGEVKTFRQKEREYQARLEELDQAIDLFLQRGQTDIALEAASRYNVTTCLVDLYREHADREETEYQNLREARSQLEARLADARREQEHLQALLAEPPENADRQSIEQAAAQDQPGRNQLEQELEDVLETGLIQEQLAERKRRLHLE